MIAAILRSPESPVAAGLRLHGRPEQSAKQLIDCEQKPSLCLLSHGYCGGLVMFKNIAVAALILLSINSLHAETLPKQSYLPLELAQKAVNAALKKCSDDGFNVSVAIVDRSGVLLSQSRHPMAGPHTIKSSFGKAFTSASVGEPSGKLASMIGEKPFLEGLRDMDERLVILGGGLPIVIDDVRVGGIGVGGAPGGHLDEACAKEGLNLLQRTAN
ncbi:hypothetical protein LCGC14_1421750 [marine sediment metagenome]